MSSLPDRDQLSREFEVLAARAGLKIHLDRLETLLAGYSELREMVLLLHSADLTALDMPAHWGAGRLKVSSDDGIGVA